MRILDGKKVAAKIYQEIGAILAKHKGKRVPKLVAIIVGNNDASLIYVRNKQKSCQAIGIDSQVYHFAECEQTRLLELISVLNNDSTVDGILVQLPLPNHIDVNVVLESIAIDKDIDSFHPYNLGKLAQGDSSTLKACTALALEACLIETGEQVIGKHAVVVGISNIVGKPCLLELLQMGATVTACHEHTKNLAEEVNRADIVLSAVGKPHIISGSWLKKGAIVIDVGINRTSNGIVGDIDISSSKNVAYYTPVPGGFGPVTVAMLIKNTVLAYESHIFHNVT